MAKQVKPETGREGVPQHFPEVPPPDYAKAVGDTWIAESMMQIQQSVGKLTANVEHLIADVRSQGGKLDAISHQASFIKGAIAVSVLLIGLFITLASFFLSSKWDAAIQALRTIAK